MDKMNVKESAEVRKSLYSVALGALNGAGFITEPIKEGALIHLPDGYFAKIAISICDASKFDLDVARAEYQAKEEARRLAAEKAAQRAQEKEEKARIAAEKAAAKAK